MSESTTEETINSHVPTKKTSIAWLYFVETDFPNKLRCTKCNQLCSFRRKSTGNLMRHMKKKHPDIYSSYATYSEGVRQLHSHTQDRSLSHSEDEIETAVEEIKDTSNEDAVQTMEIQCENVVEASIPSNAVKEQNLQATTYYLVEQIDANQAAVINNQILKVIVKNFYPFNLSESEELKTFANMLNSNYELPNYKSLSDDMLLKAYKCKVQQLKATFKEIKYLALTIDKWTSINDENFIAITVHYFDKDLTLQSNFLDCISFHKDSSVNIPIFLQELVHNWRISEKIVAVISKNDPTIVQAIKECQWQHISCFAHTLNTMIIKCLAKINDIITKVRDVVDYFKRIPNAMTELLSYQTKIGMSNVKLKKDSPNRWNSTFDMITRFLKNKDILKSQLIKNLPEELSLKEWLILENTVKLLVVFNTITVEICSEKVVSLSKIPFMIRFMLKHVTNITENMPLPGEVKAMGKRLKEELIQESKIIEANGIICQCVLLDPRMKKRGFPENAFDAAYSSLLKNVISLKNEKMLQVLTEQSGKQENPKQEYFIDVWSEFRETEKPPAKDFTPDATAEIDAFLSEAYISMKENPMTYWGDETNQNKFPFLFELVKSRLCVPASSVPGNNIFSKAENALTERRNFLSSKNLKEILFLHHNM